MSVVTQIERTRVVGQMSMTADKAACASLIACGTCSTRYLAVYGARRCVYSRGQNSNSNYKAECGSVEFVSIGKCSNRTLSLPMLCHRFISVQKQESSGLYFHVCVSFVPHYVCEAMCQVPPNDTVVLKALLHTQSAC